MLGVRAVWVIKLFPERSRKVLYFRKFLTIEQRSRHEQGNSYVDLPSEEEFLRSLLNHLGLAMGSDEFLSDRDSASKILSMPIISLKIKDKELEPVLLIKQNSLLFCCLAGGKKTSKEKNKHILHNSSVSMGFSILLGISQFFSSETKNDKLPDKINELDHYLSINMPFGSPFTFELQNTPTKKQNSWKPLSNITTSSIAMTMTEIIRSAQHAKLDDGTHAKLDDEGTQLSGTVTMKIDSLNTANEISVSFEQSSLQKELCIDSFFIHPSVHTFTRSADGFVKRIWFTPSLNELTLCLYTASVPVSETPITGLFRMKGTTLVELYIKLQLNDHFKNSFSFFDVVIPFFNRGPIQSFECKTSQGYLSASDDKHSLKWNIGGKFLTKAMDAFLTAKVDLADSPFPEHNDQFCCDENSYIKVNFKHIDNGLGHSALGPKSGTITTAHKAKVLKGFSQHSDEYKIWNTLGELPFPVVDKKQRAKGTLLD